MIRQPLLSWECRVCGEKALTRAHMSTRLEEFHGLAQGLDGDLRVQLHASKDYPQHSENTFGYYDGDWLVAIHIRVMARDANDPMRLGG